LTSNSSKIARIVIVGLVVVVISLGFRVEIWYHDKQIVHAELLSRLAKDASDGQIGNMQSDLSRGAGINELACQGSPALFWSILGGEDNVTAVNWIINQGADINLRDSNGYTALNLAAWTGQPKIVKILLDHGANIEATDAKGRSPLLDAAYMGRLDLLKVLLENKANINSQDSDGNSAVIVAATPETLEDAGDEAAHVRVINFLVNHGIDLNLRNKRGKTAIQEVKPGRFGWQQVYYTIHLASSRKRNVKNRLIETRRGYRRPN
jgi:ankyrin repeat protein